MSAVEAREDLHRAACDPQCTHNRLVDAEDALIDAVRQETLELVHRSISAAALHHATEPERDAYTHCLMIVSGLERA